MDNSAVQARARTQLASLTRAVAIARHEVQRIDKIQNDLAAEHAKDKAQAELFVQGIAALNLLMERVVGQNLSKLADDVNRALRAILPDQDLRFEVIPDVKWGKQVYSFAILHDGIPHADTTGIGGTVLSIVSLVLRVMFILYTQRYPLLVLDEGLRMVSKSHKDRTSRFVRHLAAEMGVHILLVTHDREYAVAADQNYAVVNSDREGDCQTTLLRHVDKATVEQYFSNEV